MSLRPAEPAGPPPTGRAARAARADLPPGRLGAARGAVLGPVGLPLLVAGLLALALLPGLGGAATTRTVSDLAQLAAAVVAGAAMAWAARPAGPMRRPLLALAVGTGGWAAGQAVWCWDELVAGRETPFPSPADAFFLLFPVGAVAGMLMFPSAVRPGGRSRWVLDGLIAASSLVVLSWATVLGTVAHTADTGTFGFTVSVAYPLADVVVVTIALSSLSRPTVVRTQLVVMSLALSAFAVSDSLYTYLTAVGRYRTGGPTDLGWIAAFLVLAGAARQVRQRTAGTSGPPVAGPAHGAPGGPAHATAHADRAAQPDHRPGRPVTLALAAPYVPLVAAAAVVVAQRVTGRQVGTVEILAVLAGSAAVLGRQWLTLRHNQHLLAEVERGQARLRAQAFSDQLTGLSNRALFLNRVEHALTLHRRDLRPVSVLFCDLDDFKTVNDTLGHGAGDQLLIRVAERLVGALRVGDTVARVGGDEFAVLVEDGSDPAQVGARLAGALQAPFDLDGTVVAVRASVGIAEVGAVDETPRADELMARADIAMYSAKHSGRGGLAFHAPGMALPNADDLHLREPLVTMLSGPGIGVAFQPIVDLATGRVQAFEALARWTHDDVTVSPAVFIPMAERAGLLDTLTDQVLETACGQLRRWSARAGQEQLRMSVNITPRMMTDPDLPHRIAQVVRRHEIRPGQLILEVTEDALVDDPQAALAGARGLAEIGVLLALDDFGKGYSSLLHLQQLSLHELKIDMAFTADVDRDPAAERLLAGILDLAATLQLTVVAEGIERATQADVLRGLGCPLGQGYAYGRPRPAAEHDATLAAVLTP